MIIEKYSYPRAAVIGNPSDGYFGKTIAFVFDNFSAKVQLYHTPELEIIPAKLDITKFGSIDKLAMDVNMHGYYGGERLLKGSIKVFYDYCIGNNIKLHKKNFTLRYSSDIPHRLGLAGSSAIITACMKALMSFYNVEIPMPILANLTLSVETAELGISAGLQDRVAQVFEVPVFMDFDKETMKGQGFGNYSIMDASALPRFYIGFCRNQSEGSEIIHNDLQARFKIKEKRVVDAMKEWANLAVIFKEAMKAKDYDTMHQTINRNFDLRRELIDKIPAKNIKMVELARSTGASAKFTGSGGAIIGTYKDEAMLNRLREVLGENDIEVIKPNIRI